MGQCILLIATVGIAVSNLKKQIFSCKKLTAKFKTVDLDLTTIQEGLNTKGIRRIDNDCLLYTSDAADE